MGAGTVVLNYAATNVARTQEDQFPPPPEEEAPFLNT
jgi:hypothetical protein